MNDTRNWKCFFGMHQWEEISCAQRHYFHGYEKHEGNLPYRITDVFRSKCVHCGKTKVEEF